MRPYYEHGGRILHHAAPFRVRRRQAETEKPEYNEEGDHVADVRTGLGKQIDGNVFWPVAANPVRIG